MGRLRVFGIYNSPPKCLIFLNCYVKLWYQACNKHEITEFLNTKHSKMKNGIMLINPKNNFTRKCSRTINYKQNCTHVHTNYKLLRGLHYKKEQLTSMKSGSDLMGLARSTVERGSTLRWPLWPEKPTRKDSSFVAWIGSISCQSFAAGLPLSSRFWISKRNFLWIWFCRFWRVLE